MIRQGADFHAKDENGWTLLHNAVFYRASIEVIRYCISLGMDVNEATNDGRTPLLDAAANRSFGAVEYLVAQGADVNAKDVTGRTPLHEATKQLVNVKVVQCLIAQGADVSARDFRGKTALDYLLQREAEFVELRKDATDDTNASAIETWNRHIKQVRKMIELLRQAAG